jgi:hypothetical protein
MDELFFTFLTYNHKSPIPPSCIYEGLSDPKHDISNQKANEFIEKLKSDAKSNEAGNTSFKQVSSGTTDVETNFTTSYIPPKNISIGIGSNTPNPEYDAFWNALDGYREPIIDALIKTDHPKIFGKCSSDTTNTSEGFTALWETSYFQNETLFLLIILAFIIALLCAFTQR